MCLAVPVRVVSLLPEQQAEVEVGGVRTCVSLALVEGVAVDDYVIVHAGFAISRLDVDEAEQSLALFAQIATELALAGS